MRCFRSAVRRSPWLVLLVLLCTFCYSVDVNAYAVSYRVAREEETRLEEMAKRLGVPVAKLRREQPGLIDALRSAFTNPEEEARQAGLARVEAQLKKMKEQVEANPYRPQIEEVKNAYQSHRLDGLLRDLTQLSTTEVVSLPVASRKALLRNVRESLKEDLEPHVPDDLPAKAKGKHNQLRGHLRALYAKLRKILDEPGAISDEKLAQTLGKLAAEVNQEVHKPERGPRFKDRPLPLQLREQTVPTEEVRGAVGAPSSAMAPNPSTSPQSVRRLSATTVAPEIAALAQSLGNSPARIFAHVHDNVRFDPKWGAVRSPLGTLQEGEGTSWDQAWLLLELLTAAGVEAKVEWGQVEIPVALLLTLTGTTDPFDAGNLVSTGGVPAVLLTQGGKVVGARLGHVWVKARVDYIPDRGVKPGTPDTWVRMDPSLKRYGFAAGIDVHSHVPFDLGGYLQSGTPLSPRRAYEDALFAYIRANNINCANLEQLKKAAQVVREQFPYIPGTLRGKIVRVDGESAAVLETFQQRLTLEVKTAAGGSLVTWSTPAPSVYGKRVEIDYLGATTEDQATLDAYGGVFETPPYLVDLKPVVRVAGAAVAQGSAVGSASDTEVWVTMAAPAGPPTIVTHVTSAGERHVLAADFGEVPQPVLDAHLAALTAAKAAGNASEEEAETLFLIGAQYLHNLGRDLTDLSGWKWQRLVRLGTEGLISQTGVVATTVGGAPISFRRGQRNVDIALMPLGMVPADGRRQFRREAFELLGAQSSFLEGEVFNQVLQHEGIASVTALTRSKREGQTLTRVDGANVDAVLAQADLGADAEAEIRAGVSRGQIGWVAENRIAVHQWTGTGYVLEDPGTGAAAYMISGGFAGGDETGGSLPSLADLMGTEAWLEGAPLADLLRIFTEMALGQPSGQGHPGPSTNHSDPINMSTGNLWREETDLFIQARGLPIVWNRTYNSRSGYEGPLGFGWTFNYGERLEERLDGSVLYQEGDGTEHLFTPVTGGYEAPPGKHLTLARGADTFTLRAKDGMVSEFALDGRLLSMSDANGNTVTLSYDGIGRLQAVSDAAGRTVLQVTMEDGRVTLLTDLAGRSVRYAYSGSDLVQVTDTNGKRWIFAYDEFHNLISTSDPLGNTDSYSYDSLDRCYRHADPLGNQEVFSFASQGQRAVLTDRRGFDMYVEFDGRGRASLQVDALGNASRSEWDEGNNRVLTIDPRGGVTARTFDERGNLLTEVDPLQQTHSYSYDPIHNKILTITDPTGHVVGNTYDTHGNLLEIEQVVAGVVVVERIAYNSFGQPIERRDANGNTATFFWDPATGALGGQTDALGRTSTIITDDLARITAISNPAGQTNSFQWDDKGHMVSVTDVYGVVTSFSYDDAGRQIAVTNPRGTATTAYDAAGRQVRSQDVLGNVRRIEYDAAGNPIVTTDARGNRTTSVYDPLGRPLALTDPLGQVWSFGYCAEIGGGAGGSCASGGCSGGPAGGNFCELTDPLGHTTRQDFDTLGRVVKVTDPLGNMTETTYDALGRRTASTDALDHTTRYEYDEIGRLAAVVEPDGSRTGYRYDANGNLINIRDAEGQDWPRTYDLLNRLTTEADPLRNVTTYTYDLLGNVKSRRDPEGHLVTFEYDARRLTAVVFPDGARETFGYDALGRRTSMANAEVSLSYAYDQLNRMVAVTNHTLDQTISYAYDGSGNLTGMDGPAGRVTFFYDAKDRLVEQRDPRVGTFLWSYDEADRRTKLVYPNRVETSYEYDSASHLTAVTTRNALGDLVDGYSYSYDQTGNRTAMNSLRDAVGDTYEYDDNNRLKEWRRGSGRFEQYTYDRVGNRLKLAYERGTITYEYDEANRLLAEVRQLTAGGLVRTDYVWNQNSSLVQKRVGPETTTYEYDPLHRLTRLASLAGVHTYGYDPEGIRVRETRGSDVKRFLYASEDLVGIYDGAGALDTYFAHGPGIDEALAEAPTGGDLAYIHHDGLGSVTALSSASGQLAGTVSYAAFGDVESSTGFISRYGYTGRELEASGLMYYRARYYDPGVGRFISQDEYMGTLADPASQNRYAYALNNPIRYLDPSGHTPLIFGIPAIVILASLVIALVLGVYHAFHNSEPWLRTDQKVCIGVVTGFAWWGLLLFPAIGLTWLVSWAIVWVAYGLSELGIAPVWMAYIWYYVQRYVLHHATPWAILVAVAIKVGFEQLLEWFLEAQTLVGGWIRRGARWWCGVRP